MLSAPFQAARIELLADRSGRLIVVSYIRRRHLTDWKQLAAAISSK